jgi:hypothetical protein
MKSFLSRFGSLILFVLSGFDRLRFRGESRLLNHAAGVQSYLWQRQIPFKDYTKHASQLTDQLRQQTEQQACAEGVPIKYLNSPDIDKEAEALQLATLQQRTSGRIALLSCLESCLTYRVRKNQAGLIELRKELTRGLHYYHYFQHEQFGLCYVRVQTWFPFSVRVGLNGRQWLARQLQVRGIPFQQRGNLIAGVQDPTLAQQLLDEQPRADWPKLLDDLVKPLQPLWSHLYDTAKCPYYWMNEQSEWATDFVFRSQQDLALWYPRWLRHGIETLQCKDVLRYLGKKVPADGYGLCSGEAKIDLRSRPEGVRLKFWYDTNSLKIYDKEAQSLRIETTINQPKPFKVYRTKEGAAADEPPSWQHLRRGVADIGHLAEVSQACNNRLVEDLACVADTTPLGQLLEPLGQPVIRDGKRCARALNPLVGADGDLLRLLAQGNFLLEGFRNRDLRESLFAKTMDEAQQRRQAAKITRKLRLLREHGLIVKVQKTHRYQLSALGRRVTTALLNAHASNVEKLAASA